MKRFNSFYLVNVFALELTRWDYELHTHNFYELIFVEKGSGKHLLNNATISYKKGDIFLLTPRDAHEFHIAKPTRFIYVKFDEKIFPQLPGTSAAMVWIDKFKNLLQNPLSYNGRLPLKAVDKENAFSIVNVMLSEFQQRGSSSQEMLIELFGVLVLLFSRNLSDGFTTPNSTGNDKTRLDSLLSYLRLYAIDNDKMRIEQIAAHFNMSPNYISAYVKKHTGLSIRQHIMQTKIKSAEILIKQKKFSINEIADRLGFNDSSHFNKLFKKYKGKSPTAFLKP